MNTTFVFWSSCPLCWKEHVCPNHLLISIGRDTIDELPWLPRVGLRTKEQTCIPCEVNKLFWLQRCMEYCRSSSQLGQERSSRLVWSWGIRSCCVGFVVFFIADLIICGPQKVVAALSCSSSGSKSAQGAQKVVASCLLPLPQCLIWGQFKCVQKEPDVGQQSLALVNPTGLPSKLDSSNHPYMGLLERVGPQIQWLIVMFPLKLGNLMWYIPNLRHTQMSYQLGCTQL